MKRHDVPPPADVGDPLAGAPPWLVPVIRRTVWRVWWAALLGIVFVHAYGDLRHLVNMLLVSLFLSLALAPGVNMLHNRYGWRRGAAVGAMYLAGAAFVLALVLVLLPALIEFAGYVRDQIPAWVDSLNRFTSDLVGREFASAEWATETADVVGTGLADWSANVFGLLAGVAASGIGLFFDLSSVALFTFYLTADMPRIRRAVLSHLPPRRQEPIGWAWDRAITETGRYFYSRLLIMGINGSTFFVALLLVGMPVDVALTLAVFESFIATFIPAVGTYIGAAVPIVLVLAAQGWQAAMFLLAWTLVYQVIENVALSPHISANTMNLNGGVAYGAVLAGGALAGPFGAFVSLPLAALVASFVSNYTRSYEVVYRSEYDTPEDQPTVEGGPHRPRPRKRTPS